MGIRIGIDTGGTFTDVVSYDDATDRLVIHKVHSTPDDPSRAVLTGLRHGQQQFGAANEALDLLVHGTTVATNTLLQRNGAPAALITTAGFRDVLHIQRQNRPQLYDLRSRRAEPLIPRHLRFDLVERVGPDGVVETPVDWQQLDQIIAELRRAHVEAVAIAFLHSYENPTHEKEVAGVVQDKLPHVTVCMSHELDQQIGEYERFSTCSVNAYIQPVMQRYMTRLDETLKQDDVRAPLYVMKSNGGVISATDVARECVQTILSGPAGGVVAGASIARQHKNANVITADMGGTSFDVAVIEEGRARRARDAQIDGIALRTAMLDLHTVGAGGGSIGWIDAGNALRVGPRSAGADPGPACYGRGGTEPTVTDANLVLGRLATASRLGSGLQLDVEAARRSIHDQLAVPLGLDVERVAEGMISVVNATMVAAIRKLTVQRGLDPRLFTLCPFGGAGPLHGSELARECGIRETLIPLMPGVNSAMGLLMSNLREDRVATHIALLDQVTPAQLTRLLSDLEAEVTSRLHVSHHGQKISTRQHTLAVRYLGQSHDVPVVVPDGQIDLGQIASEFHDAHQKMYGFARSDQPVELVSLWVSVELDIQPLTLPTVKPATAPPSPVAERPVIFRGESVVTPIYDRDTLAAGCEISGPAIVEQVDTTTVLWPPEIAKVDDYGQLLVT